MCRQVVVKFLTQPEYQLNIYFVSHSVTCVCEFPMQCCMPQSNTLYAAMLYAAIKHIVLVFETMETNKHSNEVAIIKEGTFYFF